MPYGANFSCCPCAGRLSSFMTNAFFKQMTPDSFHWPGVFFVCTEIMWDYTYLVHVYPASSINSHIYFLVF